VIEASIFQIGSGEAICDDGAKLHCVGGAYSHVDHAHWTHNVDGAAADAKQCSREP